MKSKETLWREYVETYDIDVSADRVQEEYEFIRADMKHRMMYAHMSGGETHLFPDAELEAQEDALRAAALFEAKEPLVLQELTKKLDIAVTPEELLAEAEVMAQRQNTTVAELKRFFGDDLALLERDVRESKIRNWACEQVGWGKQAVETQPEMRQ